MKKLFIFALLTLFSMEAFAQEKITDENLNIEVEFESREQLEKAQKDGFDVSQVSLKIEESREDLIILLGEEEAAKMVPIGVTYTLDPKIEIEDDSIMEKSTCPTEASLETEKDIDAEIVKIKKAIADSYTQGLQGVLFITWGYNRGFHSKSDIKIETPEGTIEIKDAVGNDRPSDIHIKYLSPSNFSIPQYNLKLGYWFSRDSKWGVAIGTDHMKWVFDEKQSYEIDGDYTGDLWVKGQKKPFDEIKEGNDASFLMLEHTDGYNYPYVEVLHRQKVVNTKRFEIDAVTGLGAGILFPRTRTRVANREDSAKYRDTDEFHVSGFGFHADASLVLKYKQRNGVSYFLKPTVRGVGGKITNVPLLGDSAEGKISQSMIYTLEPSVSIGAEIPLNTVFNKEKKGLKKELRKLKKIQRRDVKLDAEKTLEELQAEYDQQQAKAAGEI